MMHNFNTWLAYFPYENPTDSDPVNAITSSSEPELQAQLFSHKKYPGNILMVPPGGNAYIYNSTNPIGSLTFQIKNKMITNEPNETIITPGFLNRPVKNSPTPFIFSPLTSEGEKDPIILRKHSVGIKRPEDFPEETEGQIFFKNGLVKILHDVLPNSFLNVPDNYIANAKTIPVRRLPIPLQSQTL